MIIDFTEIFCNVDDYLKIFDQRYKSVQSCKNKPGPSGNLNRSEVLTIILGFQMSSFDCFKNYYEQYIIRHHQCDFKLISYKRFNRIMGQYLPYFLLILNGTFAGCDGKSFVDSSSIAVCKNYRIYSHKVFQGLAARGKTTKGWFFGFKLHIITNFAGELIKARFTPGNVDDRKALSSMRGGVFGKIFGDRGYISKKLFEDLYDNGIQIITKLKRNMRNILVLNEDKKILNKRQIIESVFSRIKLLGKFEHSRHRNVNNAFTHMVASLVNYQLLPHKTTLNLHDH